MNIKRFSAFLMSLIMLLTSFSIAYAENEETPSTDTPAEAAPVELINSDEFHALYAMGFLGDDIAAADKDAYVSRAQFCGYLAKLAGYAVAQHQAAEIPFIDVSIETPYYNEICTMYELGIISGTDPNMFSPKASVTYLQACKMISDVLGYGSYAQVKYGEDISRYVMMAAELDIDDGVTDTNPNNALTATNAVKMLYNAGNAYVMTLSGFDKNGNPTYATDDKTLFGQRDIYYGTGVMQSNGLCSLVSDTILENVTTIDNVNYESAAADLKGLLGSKVKFFYHEKDNDRKLLWAWEDTRFNKSVTFKATDLAINDSAYSRTNVVYYKSNGTTKEADVSPVSYVVRNNQLVSVPTGETLKIRTGTIKLIDNNDDEEYDVVIIEEFENLVVKAVPTQGENVILGKYSKQIKFDDYDVVKLYKDGKEIDKSEIGINSVISYYENEDKDKIFMYVTSGEHNGVIASTKTKRGNTYYTIDGKEYKLSYTYQKMMDEGTAAFVTPKIGEEYDFWLDIDGEIAELREGTGSMRYALIVAADRGADYEKDKVYTRMIFTDGSDTRPVIDKKLVFEGRKITVSELFNDNVSDYGAKTNYSKLFEENGEFKEQVIKVSLNEDGTVREIDVAKDNTENPYGYDLSEFSCDINGRKAVSSNNGYRNIDNKWLPDNTTIVFVEWTGANEDTSYTVSNLGAFDSNTYTMQAYDVSEKLVPKIMYKKGQSKTGYWADSYFIVEDMETVWDNQQEVKKITTYQGGAHVELIEYYPGILPETLKEGDVIRISRYNDRLTNYEYVFNLIDGTEPFIQGAINSNNCMIYAPIYGISPMGLTVETPAADLATYGPIFSTVFQGTVLKVTLYDRETHEATRVDISAINPSVVPNADGSLPDTEDKTMIFMRRKDGYIYEAIVVM